MVLGSNSVAATSTLDIASVSNKEFLDIHATTECRFTLKCICDIKKTHSLLVTLAIFSSTFTPHTFHVSFLLKRHVTRGISYPSYHMEWTDSEPFSGMIGPRHMTTSRAVAHQSCVERCSPHVL